MADRLFTSSKTDSVIRNLRSDTKLNQTELSKIAFIISLSQVGNKVAKSNDARGMRINKTSFFTDDEIFIRTLIRQVYKKTELAEDDIFSNNSIVKNHVDNGAEILNKIYVESDQDGDIFLRKLSQIASKDLVNSHVGKELDILIGKNVIDGENIVLEINNTKKHANSHLAIMGKPGVGKTQFLLKILADIRHQSNYQTNFIFFDYKGDVITNDNFVENTKTNTYRLLQNNEIIPINPFVLANYDNQAISISAREKSESFSSINSKLGPVQRGKLTEIIKTAYTQRKKMKLKYPDFKEVFSLAQELYKKENKNDDSLIEVLRDLAEYNLFWSHNLESQLIEKLADRTMIIDVHKMPVLKELVAYLVIERLYKEMLTLPDSPIENGRRTIRTILAIDEAHNYLHQKNIFLQKIVREGRSKGIFVFFASQSPSDFHQQDFNFKELLEFTYIFQTESVSSRSIQEILGCTQSVAKDLQAEISRLQPFQVISKGITRNMEYSKFLAEAFYKNY